MAAYTHGKLTRNHPCTSHYQESCGEQTTFVFCPGTQRLVGELICDPTSDIQVIVWLNRPLGGGMLALREGLMGWIKHN